ncbi:hypothetical protein QKC54_gp0182 [Megavirus baoshan]|uniref:Bro-N domain-containing protein n=1 Tax=Megavirus baoshan TaxID=2496520 RepID=A0A3S8UYF9_9VIRU|nr:hypothetical protein QKC54_gp0182 [Megavirus baoshan]AZL89738.1 hypothetical protein Mb0890 [Megavirus baoshan]
MDNIFEYIINNINICIIQDENNTKWYKILDVLNMLNLKLNYKTIYNIVSNEYVCKYESIKHDNTVKQIKMDQSNDSIITNQINNKTLFVNNYGLMQLISKSNESNAKKMWFDICNNIVPIIYQRGVYIQNNNQMIEQYLNEKNYDDNLISEYKKIFAIYLAYIGEYDGIHLLIYGKTDELTKYKLLKCREKYVQFNVIRIWEILSNDIVIDNIENQFRKTYLFNLINFISNNSTFNNIFPNLIEIIFITNNLFLSAPDKKLLIINQIYDIKYFIEIFDEIIRKIRMFGTNENINSNNTKIIDQYVKKIELTEQKYDNIKKKYQNLQQLYKLNNKYIRRLELEFKNAEAIICELKNNK